MRRISLLISRCLMLAGVLGSLMLVPRAVQAEQEVQRVYAQGIEQFQRGNYRRALAFFERAYEMEPVARILRDMAMCHRVLRNYAESVNYFRLYYRDEDPSNIEPEQRARIDEMLEEMRPHHGDIELEVTVPGAAIFIDGREVGFWPITRLVAVSPGGHVVSARRRGYDEAETRVRVAGGDTVRVTLDPRLTDPSLVAGEGPEGPEDGELDEDEQLEPSAGRDSPDFDREPEPASDAETTPAGREGRLGWWFWTPTVIAGTTALAFITTGSLMLRYRSDYDPGGATAQDDYDLMADLALATDILIGVASGMALAAVVSLIVYYATR